MYTLLIVDDEPAVLEGISRILDWKALGFGRVRTARSCYEVISHVVDWKPDVCLVDVRIGDEFGYELINHLNSMGILSNYVMMSGYDESDYACEALRCGALDYLLKPVQPEGLAQTLNRLRQALEKQADPEQLLIQRGQERLLVDLQQLVYCEVLGRKVYLHLQGLDGKTEVIDFYERLDNLQARLDARFFRCHRSYLVNLAFVRGCSGGRLRLAQGEEIPVSRLREAELRQALLAAMQKGSGYGRV